MYNVEVRSSEEARAWVNTDIVITKFSATWCRPCKVLHSLIEEESKNPLFDRVTLLQVDIDDEELSSLTEEHEVKNIPHIIIHSKLGHKEVVKGNNIDKIKEIISDMKKTLETRNIEVEQVLEKDV